MPYTERRARLDELAVDGPRWQTPPAFIGIPGADVQAVSRQHGLEGIMAKRLASRYEAGRRSSSWRKIKNVQRQEFVIGGYRPGEGVRTDQIGSLIVGVYGPEGLTFAGHVGTGFTRQTLAMLMTRLAPLRRKTTPFGDTIPPDQARGAVWTEPEVVIEAEFALWTSAGRLRAATYRGDPRRQEPRRRRPRVTRDAASGRYPAAPRRASLRRSRSPLRRSQYPTGNSRTFTLASTRPQSPRGANRAATIATRPRMIRYHAL